MVGFRTPSNFHRTSRSGLTGNWGSDHQPYLLHFHAATRNQLQCLCSHWQLHWWRQDRLGEKVCQNGRAFWHYFNNSDCYNPWILLKIGCLTFHIAARDHKNFLRHLLGAAHLRLVWYYSWSSIRNYKRHGTTGLWFSIYTLLLLRSWHASRTLPRFLGENGNRWTLAGLQYRLRYTWRWLLRNHQLSQLADYL